jgi:hypothetical protein
VLATTHVSAQTNDDGDNQMHKDNGDLSKMRTMLIGHGILAALAFVILFPSGAIVLRLAHFPGVIWLHAAFQIFAYLVYIAGFGLGVYAALEMDLMNDYHPILGVCILLAILIMPVLGQVHHKMFKKYGHRTGWSYAHIWVGRIAITLGIINGAMGLKEADDLNAGLGSTAGMWAYVVVGLIMWLAWMASIFIAGKRKKAAAANASAAPVKLESQRRHH